MNDREKWRDSSMMMMMMIGVIKSKCRGKLKADVLFLRSNMPVYIAQVVVVEAANRDKWIATPFPLLTRHLHLIFSCFLNTSPSCVIAILETTIWSNALWRSFWRTKIPAPSVMKLQCLSIIGQSALMSKGRGLKGKTVKNCHDSPTPSGLGLELFETILIRMYFSLDDVLDIL